MEESQESTCITGCIEAGANIKTDQMENEQTLAEHESSEKNRIAKMNPSRRDKHNSR